MTTDLIKALEAATESTPEINGKIALMTGHYSVFRSKYRYYVFTSKNEAGEEIRECWPQNGGFPDYDASTGFEIILDDMPPAAWVYFVDNLPDYMGTIDMALKLMPQGICWSIGLSQGGFEAGIFRPDWDEWLYFSHNHSAAIALVIAALKAREAMKDNSAKQGEGNE